MISGDVGRAFINGTYILKSQDRLARSRLFSFAARALFSCFIFADVSPRILTRLCCLMVHNVFLFSMWYFLSNAATIFFTLDVNSHQTLYNLLDTEFWTHTAFPYRFCYLTVAQVNFFRLVSNRGIAVRHLLAAKTAQSMIHKSGPVALFNSFRWYACRNEALEWMCLYLLYISSFKTAFIVS